MSVAVSERVDRLLPILAELELDALLVSGLVNVRYLTGFTGTNGICVVGPDMRVFLTDFRYVEQAERQVQGFERVRGERDLLGDVAKRLLESGVRRVAFEDHKLAVRQHRRLSESLEGIELVASGDLVERLRAVKDPDELRAIREAAALADEVYALLPERGLAGRTERDVAFDLEQAIRKRGSEPSFPTIVAAGPHAALPHAEPRDEPIREGEFVIVDMGVVVDGYCSDCTRTLAAGSVGGQAAEIHELVLRAQETALAAVRAGAGCREVDAAGREIIEAAGYGERLGHGLGHGVGLEVHEGPRLSPSSTDGDLQAGNVVTIEPGVYLPGALGVRIEDLVVVTDEGCEVLTGFPKSPDAV
jgi:Xaa-Pro aminopeptidase